MLLCACSTHQTHFAPPLHHPPPPTRTTSPTARLKGEERVMAR